MRRKVVVAVLAAALVGIAGAEGIIKARQATLPKGVVSVEEVESVVVTAKIVDDTNEQKPVATVATM